MGPPPLAYTRMRAGFGVKTVIDKIEALTRQPGYIYTFSLILLRDLFFSPKNSADINWHEHLNFQELTFLAGLLVKGEIDLQIPNEADSVAWFEHTYSLFEELHRKHHEYFLDQLLERVKDGVIPGDRAEDYRKTFGSGTIMTEPIFYGGSGAYDFQYLEFAARKYAADGRWIRERIGLDIPKMGQISRELKNLHERKYNSRPRIKSGEFSKFCAAALAVSSFEGADLQKFGTDPVEAFLKTFSLVPGKVNSNLQLPGQFNDLQSRPIVRLTDGRYFLPVGFSLSEAIYESPFFWMNLDSQYQATALLHRGQFAEAETAKLLGKVFGTSNVYTDVQVRENKGRTLTDIDVLAVVGNKAVIAQVKSKRLTELAKLGDETRLVGDFKLAVQGGL